MDQPAEVPLYYVNVGLFSQPENAENAHDRLLESKLPSVMKELKTAKGRQIRVRVGPYTSEQQAYDAAATIRAMKLEARVIRQ